MRASYFRARGLLTIRDRFEDSFISFAAPHRKEIGNKLNSTALPSAPGLSIFVINTTKLILSDVSLSFVGLKGILVA